MNKFLLSSLLFFAVTNVQGEDIELYISETVKQAQTRPQVLIIFDNSGSMSTTESVKASYDPSTTYPAVGGLNSLSDKFVYFTKGGVDANALPVPDSPSEARRFLDDINSCQTARDILDTYGFYTGHIREYSFQGNSGSWDEIPDNNGANIEVIDCEDDVLAVDDDNAGVYSNQGTLSYLPSGFPVDGEGTKNSPVYHTNSVDDSNVEWSGPLVTLYTDNYLRWYQNSELANETRSRLDIAQESVNNLVNASPYVDFGLQVFNFNDGDEAGDPNGGRIVYGIQRSTDASRADFLEIIDDELDPETWTPLCESLYEASRYFAGAGVEFGNDDANQGGRRGGYNKNTPPRDTSIENNLVYTSPFSSCSDKAYIILITDGAPTYDNGADNFIKALSVVEDGSTINFSGTPFPIGTDHNTQSYNYLALLAGWMNDHDINPNLVGKQTANTYTIGFGQDAQDDAEPLLKQTAILGGGKYFPAQDTASLTAALTNVLQSLEPSNDSLTSASVAANNFDRTETLNSVYYAMFQPNRGPRWQGNLKKYKVINGTQVGKNGKNAINEATGHFSEDVTSYWSLSVDGDKVSKGGVADMLRNKTGRVIYSDVGTNDSLVPLTLSNVTSSFGDSTALAAEMDVPETDIEEYLNWAKGVDVDDEDDDNSTTDMRVDTFGDPLHSKPLVINYGNSIRIVIGTNAGALHMFEDKGDTVDENWAFMPKEFFSNIKGLRDNYSTADKIYGIDGRITSYIKDENGDGIVNGTDKVWIFFGLRRGGTSYYGVDISNPASPQFMWHIDSNTTGFSELGQTWSQPKLGYSKINVANNIVKPILFFGGGYDISKDNTGVGAVDTVGRAIYMVDAETGALKWSMAPSNAATVFSGTDSIAASVATLDSDGDGLIDRLYAGDTGGNVWRVDMPDETPGGDDPWTVFKLASLGSDVADDNANDRRFFNEPAIVRTFISETVQTTTENAEGETETITVKQEKPYDAILIGSGDRSNPIGTDTDDKFFMIKDESIKTKSFISGTNPATITLTDLYDYTNDPFGADLTTQALETLSLAVSAKKGWFIDLTQSGEKSSASAIVINGVVYFTSFTPPSLTNQVSCDLPNGQGWLYAVDLALGTNVYNWEAENYLNRDDRIAFISEQFLGSPTLIVIPTDDGDPDTIDESEGNIIVGRKIISVGFTLQTLRTYLFVTEED